MSDLATRTVNIPFMVYAPLLRVSGDSLTALTDAGRESVVGILGSFAHRNGHHVQQGSFGVIVDELRQWTEPVEVPDDWRPLRFEVES